MKLICVTERTPVVAPLCPAQATAASELIQSVESASVAILKCETGKGRSAILEHVRSQLGGALIALPDFMALLQRRHPSTIEETLLELLGEALDRSGLVLVDDFHLIVNVVESCDYPRGSLLHVAMKALLERARLQGKRLIFGTHEYDLSGPIYTQGLACEVGAFDAGDYEAICRAHLDPTGVERLDFATIFRFAPKLNAYQLRNACIAQRRDPLAGTDSFVSFVRAHNMESNVEIAEVPPVDWKDLKGVDDVIQALETKIAFPFDHGSLAAELGIKPKRGVLLAGPPGTGKTTIGRALAHRLKSKFFLIDGTVVAGSRNFYQDVGQVFERAKRNAPAVIFIDDADVIFESDDKGFYRYLLTMLDGLESASAGRVCLMLTAMDVGSLPPALVRSGRVELWLETRLPDAEARRSIFEAKLAGMVDDLTRLVALSDGMTGADLQAAIEEGRLLLAYDKSQAKPLRPAETYFQEALKTIQTNRRDYGRRKYRPFGGARSFGFAGSI
jgi:hypothetical protein